MGLGGAGGEKEGRAGMEGKAARQRRRSRRRRRLRGSSSPPAAARGAQAARGGTACIAARQGKIPDYDIVAFCHMRGSVLMFFSPRFQG